MCILFNNVDDVDDTSIFIAAVNFALLINLVLNK